MLYTFFYIYQQKLKKLLILKFIFEKFKIFY